MAGTKRGSPGSCQGPRKSRRTKSAPNRYGQPSQHRPPAKLKYTRQRFDDIPEISTHRIERLLNAYGDLVPFLPTGRADDEDVQTRHKDIEQATAAIFATCEAGQMKISELMNKIRSHMPQQHPAALCSKWYWNSNIFDLQPSELSLMLRHYPIIDTSDLCLYLQEVMSGNTHPRHGRDHHEAHGHIEAAATALESSRDPRRRFSIVQFASTALAQLTRRICDDQWGNAYRIVRLFETLCGHVMGAIREEPQPAYLNAAAARRSVWRAYEATRCTTEWRDDSDCVHVELLVVLELLQAVAHQELRKNTYLAVGDKLPVELVDHILEATPELEGIPLDSEISELLEEPRPADAHREEDEIMVQKVLPSYTCYNVQYDRRGEQGRRQGAEFTRYPI